VTCRRCGSACCLPLYLREDAGRELRHLYGYRRDDALCDKCESDALHYGRKLALRHGIKMEPDQ